MNHSLITADRTTHLKIAAVALIGAIMVVAVGIGARLADEETATAAAHSRTLVVKAGKPAAYSSQDGTAVR